MEFIGSLRPIYMKALMNQRLIIGMILLLSITSPLFACTCDGTSTVKGSLEGSDLVIIGKVISGEEFRALDSTIGGNRYYSYPKMRYRVAIKEKFKGNCASDTITIITGLGGGDCGYQFGVGYEYLIYGYKQFQDKLTNQPVNVFETNICTRTRDSSDTKEILELRTLVGKKD